MAGFGGAVKLTGESEYRKALKSITTSLKEVDSELKLVSSQYDKTDRSQEALSAQADALSKKYEQQSQKVKVLTDNYESMAQKADENKTKHAALKSELDAETQKLQKIEAESGKTSEAYQEQAAKVSQLSADYKKSQDAIDGQGEALSRAKIELNNATAAMNATESTINSLNAEMENGAESADNLGKDVKDAGDKAQEASNGGFTVFKGMLADLASNAIQAALSGLRQLGSALIDVGGQALSSYADYEQLVGGVETLFGAGGLSIEEYAQSVGRTVDQVRGEYNNLQLAQSEVLENASNAYATAGMSANEYMETVTSFSAALIASLDGQTETAAQAADQALIDMADNANKMGTDLESIQQAYLGFSRGQYQLLDGLKLGYGGSKTEMERLLADAQAISGVEYNIDNLADVYEAIHVVQTEMGITGTTAREAASTISGSTQMVSASWQNLLAGLADDNANLNQLIGNFIDSIMTAASNILPRVQTILEGMGTLAGSLLEELVPQLIDMIPPLLETGLPILLDAVESVLTSLLSILPQVIPIISGLIPQICSSIISLLPQILNAGIQILLSLISGLSSAIPQLLGMLPSLISQVANVILSNLPLIITTGIELLISLITGISEALPQLIELLPEIIIQVQNTILDNLPLIVSAGIQLLTAVINGILTALPSLLTLSFELPLQIAENIRDNLPHILETGKQILISLAEGLISMISFLGIKIRQVITEINTKFAELPDRIIEVGKDLVRGLWEGINDMTAWVISKIQGFGESVLSGIRAFFGIESPSKLFENEVGKYLAEGIGVGFADEMQNVTAEMQDAIPTSFNVGTDLNSGSLSAMGGYDYLTLVQAFEEALGDMTVELDGVNMGKFVTKTVTNAIYQ